MELGVAGTIAVAQIMGNDIQNDINDWLQSNPDAEVIDIKFSTTGTSDGFTADALIVYRKGIY